MSALQESYRPLLDCADFGLCCHYFLDFAGQHSSGTMTCTLQAAHDTCVPRLFKLRRIPLSFCFKVHTVRQVIDSRE